MLCVYGLQRNGYRTVPALSHRLSSACRLVEFADSASIELRVQDKAKEEILGYTVVRNEDMKVIIINDDDEG